MTVAKKFFKYDDVYMMRDENSSTRFDKLPTGTYLVVFSMEQGYYLKAIPSFELPPKIYGNINARAERILNTFEDRPNTTGVLLSGEKGSGKTLLTKNISLLGAKRKLPTIVVNQSYHGDGFNLFLQAINQDCIVLFDEFEKVYDSDEQKSLLTLFDGIFSSKKLILLTTNSFSAIDDHLKNRPGRIYYNLEFTGLDMNFVKEYGEEKLDNQNYMSSLFVLASIVQPFNFDILKAVVEESNRYKESPMATLDMLNVKMNTSYSCYHKVKLKIKGKTILTCSSSTYDPKDENAFRMRLNPLKNRYSISYYYIGKNGKPTYDEMYVTSEQLTKIDAMEGVYIYEDKNFTFEARREDYMDVPAYKKYQKFINSEDDEDYQGN